MGGLLHLVQRRGDWAGPQPAQAPLRCTKCNNPPINGQCTNFILFDVHCNSQCRLKGYMHTQTVSNLIINLYVNIFDR